MVNQIIILSAYEISKFYNPDYKRVLVYSFVTPGFKAPKLSNYLDSICTHRHIIFAIDSTDKCGNESDSLYIRERYHCFDTDDAILVLESFYRYKEEIDTIICQCEAGISRSAGLASALSIILGIDDSWIYECKLPNSRIKSLTLNTWITKFGCRR